MKKNIVLTGFMGTGKTAVGKSLSASTRMRYVSVDDMISRREGKTIKVIFDTKGEKYFRQIERDVIRSLSLEYGQIIDCGGGAILDEVNLENLRSSGHIFCLWADPEVIFKRVSSCSNRPLLNVEDPMKKINELLEKRRSCYLKAEFHIDTTNMRPVEVAEEIRRRVDALGT